VSNNEPIEGVASPVQSHCVIYDRIEREITNNQPDLSVEISDGCSTDFKEALHFELHGWRYQKVVFFQLFNLKPATGFQLATCNLQPLTVLFAACNCLHPLPTGV
jgi:hypothetical protein